MGEWTFFSNHGHVLVCLARDREARLRDVAVQVGITERAVQKIVRDMQDAGYLEVSKHGRRNRYRINNRKALRHSLQSGCTVGQLLKLLGRKAVAETGKEPEPIPESKPPEIDQPALIESPADHQQDTSSKRIESDREESRHGNGSVEKPKKTDLEQGQLF